MEGVAAALSCSLLSIAVIASNQQLQTLDWPCFFITGTAALLGALGNITYQRWHGLARPPDVRWVMLRGLCGSGNGFLGICAVLAGAYMGSIAAFRSVNSIVASLGTVAMGEEFGWMHLVSVALFVMGAILTADPEEVVATMGSTLLGNGLALGSGISSGFSALIGRKVKEVHPSFLTTANLLQTWLFCWMLHFIIRVPSGNFQSMEGARPQSVLLLLGLPVILHFNTMSGAVASQKCSAAVVTTVKTASSMLAGFCLDYLLQGHAKLVTILGALLIFLAVLAMLQTQLGNSANSAPKDIKEKLKLLPSNGIANI